MIKSLLAIILITIIFSLSFDAHAENCWMGDCKNTIGFIYIPTSQYGGASWMQKMREKDTTGNPLVFDQPGLPKVDEIRALTVFTVLLKAGAIPNAQIKIHPKTGPCQSKDEVPGPENLIFNCGTKTYRYDSPLATSDKGDDSWGMPMAPKTKVRILGYQGFASADGNTDLFALVLVMEDGVLK